MKATGKSLAILLAAALVGTPISATAIGSPIDAVDAVENAVVSSTPSVVSEESTLREQSTKHFRLSDGSYMAVVYNEPVHYKQGNEWAEIDNSLVSASLVGEPSTGIIKRDTELTEIDRQNISSKISSPNRQYNTAYYENNVNDFKVQMPKGINSNTPIVVNHEGHSLRFCFNDSASVSAKVVQPMSEAESAQKLQSQLTGISNKEQRATIQNEFATTIQKNRSSVSYSSIKSNMDLNYYIIGQSLKEDIVLHSLPASASFSFSFTYSGLQAVLEEDNSVTFYDEAGESIFVIASPFMFDSDEGYSNDISVVLESTDTGCNYTLIPDRKWLEANERIYPVTLDPTIYTTQNAKYILDNGVQEANAGTNYMTYNRIYVGTDQYKMEGRLYFNLSQWPSASNLTAASITGARLNFNYYPQANWQTAYQMTIDVYKLSSPWDTGKITWNSQKNIGGTRISSKYISDSRNKTSGYDTFDVTAWVRAHYTNSSTDYGIRLQPSAKDTKMNRLCYISSDYTGNTSLRPIIYIDYHNRQFGMVGITDNGHDHTSFMNNRIPAGYTRSSNTNTSPQATLNVLRASRAFVSRSHGYREGITCSGGNMTRNDVLALPPGALSHMQLVYYGACSTGEGGSSAANLVNATFDRGARTVIGFTVSVGCGTANTWTQEFMTNISNGETVDRAMELADRKVSKSPDGTNQRLERGATNVTVN